MTSRPTLKTFKVMRASFHQIKRRFPISKLQLETWRVFFYAGNFSYFPFAKIKDLKSPNLTKKCLFSYFPIRQGKMLLYLPTIRELSFRQNIFFDSIKNTLIKDDIENNKEEIIILKTNVANNKEDIGENDAKIGSLSDKVASFKTVLDSNTDDINALEDDVFQNAKDMGRNDEDIANLEKIVSNNTKGSSMSLLNNLFTSQICQYSLFRIKYASTLQGQNKFHYKKVHLTNIFINLMVKIVL